MHYFQLYHGTTELHKQYAHFFMSACTKRQDILEIYSVNLQK